MSKTPESLSGGTKADFITKEVMGIIEGCPKDADGRPIMDTVGEVAVTTLTAQTLDQLRCLLEQAKKGSLTVEQQTVKVALEKLYDEARQQKARVAITLGSLTVLATFLYMQFVARELNPAIPPEAPSFIAFGIGAAVTLAARVLGGTNRRTYRTVRAIAKRNLASPSRQAPVKVKGADDGDALDLRWMEHIDPPQFG